MPRCRRSAPRARVDLSGRDVAGKLVILLREAGIAIEREHVSVESLEIGDDEWRARTEAAERGGKRLVYVASYENGIAAARVQDVDGNDALARLRPGENIVVYHTTRYATVPLTIAGPGAGPDVTAAGVLAEILDAARNGEWSLTNL